MKVIFVSDSKNNVILEGENYHYLIVKGARTSKEKFVCAFDGELSRMQDGGRYTIADLLVRHIQANGPFYLDPNTTPRTASPKKRIEEVIYSLYYQKPLNTTGLKIKIANRKGIIFTSWSNLLKATSEAPSGGHMYTLTVYFTMSQLPRRDRKPRLSELVTE